MLPTPSFAAANSIAILGCGWLGLPLARLLRAQGYPVSGSTTSADKLPVLEAAGIRAELVQLSPELPATDPALTNLLAGCTTLLINVPPRSRLGIAYPHLLQPVATALLASSVKQVLFISSTGVYPDAPGLVQEDAAQASATAASEMLQAEYLFQSLPGIATTVVRLAGLMGPGRPPGRFLAGRTNVPAGSAPVNLIHLQDCLGIIVALLQQPFTTRTFNACAAQHPLRRDFYPLAAQQLGLQPPTFADDQDAGGKTIDSRLIRAYTGYQFQYDDLMAALAAC